MGIEEIRRAKADALLEFQEAENRIMDLRSKIRDITGKIEQFAKLLSPSDTPGKTGALAVNAPNYTALQNGAFKDALDYEAAVQLAGELRDAVGQLAEVQQKKIELGLR